MPGNIWVVAAVWRGQSLEATYEAVALGRELAGGLGVALEVVLLGSELKNVLSGLGKADIALCVEHAALADPVPEVHAHVLVQLAKANQPQAILVPLTNVTWEIGSLVAAELGTPYINSCKNVCVVQGVLEARTLLYGGKMEAAVRSAHAPTIFALVSGVRPAKQGYAEQAPSSKQISGIEPPTSRVKLKCCLEPQPGDVDISKQDVLVGIGRGIQSQENVGAAEDLAAALGGAVCGSRPVIDQGWLPVSRQVGKSGATVKPKLYIAAGISGAPEHVEGMKDSHLIIAINRDPQAPIFQIAHFGIVADLVDLLPALGQAIRRRAPTMRRYA